MFIKEKVVNGIKIYIKNTSLSIDAMYQIGSQKEISFINYGPYFSLKLFECNDKLYVIRRCEKNTFIIPVVVGENRVTWGKMPIGDFLSGYWSEEQLENYLKSE